MEIIIFDVTMIGLDMFEWLCMLADAGAVKGEGTNGVAKGGDPGTEPLEFCKLITKIWDARWRINWHTGFVFIAIQKC